MATVVYVSITVIHMCTQKAYKLRKARKLTINQEEADIINSNLPGQEVEKRD